MVLCPQSGTEGTVGQFCVGPQISEKHVSKTVTVNAIISKCVI